MVDLTLQPAHVGETSEAPGCWRASEASQTLPETLLLLPCRATCTATRRVEHCQLKSTIQNRVRRPSFALFFSPAPVFGAIGAAACIASPDTPPPTSQPHDAMVPTSTQLSQKARSAFGQIGLLQQQPGILEQHGVDGLLGMSRCAASHTPPIRVPLSTLSPQLGTRAASRMPPRSKAPHWLRLMSTLQIALNVRRHRIAFAG